jgi:hypothetical protein
VHTSSYRRWKEGQWDRAPIDRIGSSIERSYKLRGQGFVVDDTWIKLLLESLAGELALQPHVQVELCTHSD